MRRLVWLSGIFCLTLSAQAQEAILIKFKEPAVGDVRSTDFSQSTQTVTKIVGSKDAVLHERTTSLSQHFQFRETVLVVEKGLRHPARLRREYDKAAVWVDKKPETLPYQGKTLLIEKRAPGYQFQVDGGEELTGLGVRLLEREFNKEENLDLQRLVLPAGPVSLDQPWSINMQPVALDWQKNTTMQVDVTRSIGSGRLKKIYVKDGRRFGIMTFRLEMPLVALGGLQQLKMEGGSRVVLEATLDGCIDGESATRSLKAHFWVDGACGVPAADGGQTRLTFSTRGAIQDLRTETR